MSLRLGDKLIASGSTAEVNIPHSLGESKYSPIELDNMSWLDASIGTYYSGPTYPSFYNHILEKANNGENGYKFSKGKIYQFTTADGWTPSFTIRNPKIGSYAYGGDPILPKAKVISISGDTLTCNNLENNNIVQLTFKQELDISSVSGWITENDYSIDTSNSTFRLPLLDGSEDLPSDRYENLTLKPSGEIFYAPANGVVSVRYNTVGTFCYCHLVKNDTVRGTTKFYDVNGLNGMLQSLEVSKGETYSLHYSGMNFTDFEFCFNKGNGKLFYYVGETIQNANIIDFAQTKKDLLYKTGGTVTGDLLVEGLFNTKAMDIDVDVAPEAQQWYGQQVQDKNGTRIGMLEVSMTSNKDLTCGINVRREVDGTPKYSAMIASIDTNGNASCTFPNTTCVDGQWVSKGATLSSATSVATRTFDLKASYLPNDNYKYEVLCYIAGYQDSSGTNCSLYVYSDLIGTSMGITVDSNKGNAQDRVSCIIPVQRYLYGNYTGGSFTSCALTVTGYRRIGTNE